jgi:hypothetical protein
VVFVDVAHVTQLTGFTPVRIIGPTVLAVLLVVGVAIRAGLVGLAPVAVALAAFFAVAVLVVLVVFFFVIGGGGAGRGVVLGPVHSTTKHDLTTVRPLLALTFDEH